MKKCRRCHVEKDICDFYIHSRMADGRLNICKTCVKSRVSKYRKENVVSIREYDLKRSKLPHRLELTRIVTKNWRSNSKNASKAHCKVYRAIASGKLTASPCEVCGDTNVHGHHDDYLKPLNVRWLCAIHHKEWHDLNGPGLNIN